MEQREENLSNDYNTWISVGVFYKNLRMVLEELSYFISLQQVVGENNWYLLWAVYIIGLLCGLLTVTFKDCII